MRSPVQVRPSLFFNMKKKEWFKIRYYPHIGFPIRNADKKKVCSYIKTPKNIQSHSFFPFIHKTITTRRFRKEYDIERNLLNEGKRVVLEPKKRDIFYSNHLDANIFSYYGHLLNKQYTKVLRDKGLNEVVTAYRQIPHFEDDKATRNKCNIDFALEVFNFIRNKNANLVAITFDISNFFDKLNHELLKKMWCKIFAWKELPDDHYNVFKNITKFSYVEEKPLFELFKYQIITKTKSGSIKKKKIDKPKYLYNGNAIAYCEKSDIHLIRSKGLIKNNKRENGELRKVGICQGSPISSVLANIYMLEFDEHIKNEIEKVNGLYRRYSDDIVIVCPPSSKDFFINLLKVQIEILVKLEIQDKKTQIFHFTIGEEDNLVCAQEINGKINHNSYKYSFDYLGFSFNGNSISLKTSSLAKYYRKLKLNVRRCIYYSQVIRNETNGKIFKRRIYKRFSYIGAKRTRKYKRKPGTTDKWIRTDKYNWGNYITYARFAYKTMKDIRIKSQIKNHWKNINRMI